MVGIQFVNLCAGDRSIFCSNAHKPTIRLAMLLNTHLPQS